MGALPAAPLPNDFASRAVDGGVRGTSPAAREALPDPYDAYFDACLLASVLHDASKLLSQLPAPAAGRSAGIQPQRLVLSTHNSNLVAAVAR